MTSDPHTTRPGFHHRTTGDRSDDTLHRLAGLIADVTPVDWDEEQRRHPHLSSTLNALRWIEALSLAFRAAAAGDRVGFASRRRYPH